MKLSKIHPTEIVGVAFETSEDSEVTLTHGDDLTLSEQIFGGHTSSLTEAEESELFSSDDSSVLAELAEITTIVEPGQGEPTLTLTYPVDEQFPVLSVLNARQKLLDQFEFHATYKGATRALRMQRFNEGADHASWQFLIWDEASLNQVLEHAAKVAVEMKLALKVNKQALLSRLASIVPASTPRTPGKYSARPKRGERNTSTSRGHQAQPKAKKPAQPVVKAEPVAPAKPKYLEGEDVVGRVKRLDNYGVIIAGPKGEGFLRYEERNAVSKGGVDHSSLLVNVEDEINVRVVSVEGNGFARFTFRSLPDLKAHFLSCLVSGREYEGVIQGVRKYGYVVNIGGPDSVFLANEEVPESALQTGLKTNQKVTVRFKRLNPSKGIAHVTMHTTPHGAQPVSGGRTAAA